LRHSQKKCECTPWNYPQYQEKDITEICDGPLVIAHTVCSNLTLSSHKGYLQTYCFEEAMDEEFNKTSCGCINDCEEIVFTVTEDMNTINIDAECDTKNIHASNVADPTSFSVIVAEKLRHMEGKEYQVCNVNTVVSFDI
jgi:hypothetical protein